MIVFIYDTETTGLDPSVDRIVQHGLLVLDLKFNKVIDIISILAWDKDFPAVAASGKVHGWTLPCLMKYATHPGNAIARLHDAYQKYLPDAILAHNGTKYDKNMLAAEINRWCVGSEPRQPSLLLETPWLDTQHHAEYEGCPSKSLLTVAAHHEFINPFPHDAVSDCFTIVSILKRNPTLLLSMAKRAAATKSLIFANLPQERLPRAEFDVLHAKLKAAKFLWQDCEGYHYEKSWIRIIERDKFEEFASTCPFQVNIIKDIPAPDHYDVLYREMSEFYDKKWHA